MTNSIGKDVLAEVACLVGSEDLKFHLIKTCWKRYLSFKEARLASIIQNEFL
jgi:hypothetical protein